MAVSVLVVEDDATLANTIARNLLARGYSAWSAGTVGEATSSLAQRCPNILLLDIDLPDGSGWEVARALRASGEAATIVVLSAMGPNPRLAAELGCAAVLDKPFPMEALLRLIAGVSQEPEEKHA